MHNVSELITTLSLLKERAVTRLSLVVAMPTMWRASRMVDSRKYYQDVEAGECMIMCIHENEYYKFPIHDNNIIEPHKKFHAVQYICAILQSQFHLQIH
jgi:hypothetical protein